jgi:hypothetical protein
MPAAAEAAARSGAASALVSKNGVFRLRDHLVPAAFRKFVEIRAPCRARIVDEDVEPWLKLLDLAGEHLDPGEARNVDRQRDAFGAIFGRKLSRGRLARRRLAR